MDCKFLVCQRKFICVELLWPIMKKYIYPLLITLSFSALLSCQKKEASSATKTMDEVEAISEMLTDKEEEAPTVDLVTEPKTEKKAQLEVATQPQSSPIAVMKMSKREELPPIKMKAKVEPKKESKSASKAPTPKVDKAPKAPTKKLPVKHIKDPFYNKKGLANTLRTPGIKKGKKVYGTYIQNMPKVKKLNVGWNYSWSMKLQPTQPEKTSFAPMVYSVYGQPDIQTVTNNLFKQVVPVSERQEHVVVFGYNEPDKKNQANMSVERALKYWESLERLNVPLCSPSCVHPDNKWMKDFMKGVEKKKLRVNYIGVHDYGDGSPEQFKAKLKRIHKLYGRPIIVTEFAVADWNAKTVEANKHSPKKVLKFMKEVLPWMDKQDWIAGYAWFSFDQNKNVGHSSALFDGKGNLTTLGEFYAKHKPR